jgi:choline kinase
MWTPASHALWAVWAVIQARDDILARIERWTGKKAGPTHGDEGFGPVDFAYLEYGEERLSMFRKELKRLGV